MANRINRVAIDEFLSMAGAGLSIVDVRAPSEYERGHIPGSVNIPLFSDEERAVVGTAYKKEGKERATHIGLDFVGPKMSNLLNEGLKAGGESRNLLMYCWRGGLRSESMGWLFDLGGISVTILEGGYKAYRNHILGSFSNERNVVILGGLTGSGKTDILYRLREQGEQVIDLEGIANHRGSAFGALGMPAQPTSEQFANLLYHEMIKADPEKRLFLEDESRNIGSVFMPDEVYDLIRSSPLVAIMTDVKSRMPRLLVEYGSFEPGLLIDSLVKISKRLGGDNTAEAIKAVETGNIERAIEIVLVYYDKSYRYGLSKRDSSKVHIIETFTGDAGQNATKVIETAERAGL